MQLKGIYTYPNSVFVSSSLYFQSLPILISDWLTHCATVSGGHMFLCCAGVLMLVIFCLVHVAVWCIPAAVSGSVVSMLYMFVSKADTPCDARSAFGCTVTWNVPQMGAIASEDRTIWC